MLKIFILASLTFVSSMCFAADHEIQICGLQARTSSNFAYINVCGGWAPINNCGSTANAIGWDISKGQGQSMYATALTAMTTGMTVKARINTGSTFCVAGGYDEVEMIQLVK